MTDILWFEGFIGKRVGRYSDFRHQTYQPAFPVWVASWAFVSGYSSATVADSHGIPCADAVKELGED